MLAAFALLLIQTPEVPPIQWECERGTPLGGGLLLVVRRLGADGRLVDDHLRWHIPQTDGLHGRVEWALSGQAPGAARGWSMWSRVGLSRWPSGPISAILRADGRELSRRPVSLHPLRAWDERGRPLVMLDYRDGPAPGMSDPPTAPMPELGEARNVEILIEEAGGAQLGRFRLVMPDWALARPEIGLMRTVLGEDAAAYRTRCRDITIPVEVRIRREDPPPR